MCNRLLFDDNNSLTIVVKGILILSVTQGQETVGCGVIPAIPIGLKFCTIKQEADYKVHSSGETRQWFLRKKEGLDLNYEEEKVDIAIYIIYASGALFFWGWNWWDRNLSLHGEVNQQECWNNILN